MAGRAQHLHLPGLEIMDQVYVVSTCRAWQWAGEVMAEAVPGADMLRSLGSHLVTHHLVEEAVADWVGKMHIQ